MTYSYGKTVLSDERLKHYRICETIPVNDTLKIVRYIEKGLFFLGSIILLKRVSDLHANGIFYPMEISIYKEQQDSQVVKYTSEGNVAIGCMLFRS